MLPAFFDKTKKLPQDIETNMRQVDSSDSATVVLDFTTADTQGTSLSASTGPLGSVETVSPFSFILPKEESSTTSSQESTASQSTSEGRHSSEEEPIPFVLPKPDHVVIQIPEQTPSIANRIIRNYELRLMSVLPAVHEKFNLVTIITPEGVHQLNQELNVFKCLITADEFKTKHGSVFLNRAEYVTAEEGELIHDELTLKELNLLESSIRMRRGHTIIGYSINEEVYVRVINTIISSLIRIPTDYPPLPDAYSRRLLAFISQPVVFDITSSLRGALQTFLLSTYFLSAYFQYNNKDVEEYNSFVWSNSQWLLVGLSGVNALIFIYLRSGCVEKQFASMSIDRLRTIEQATLGFGQNWMNYGLLIMPKTILNYGFFPVLLIGAIKGYFKKDTAIINIRRFTALQLLEKNFFSALTVGSFSSLGLGTLINSFCFFYKNLSNPSLLNQFNTDLSIAQYSAFSLMFLLSTLQYPYLSSKCQYVGLYSSNIMSGLAYALLDTNVLFGYVELIVGSFFGQHISPNQTGILTVYFGLQALIVLSSLLITFPTTKNIPTFSVEKIPNENKSFLTKTYEKSIDFISLCFSFSHSITTGNESFIDNQEKTIQSDRPSFFYDKKRKTLVNIEMGSLVETTPRSSDLALTQV